MSRHEDDICIRLMHNVLREYPFMRWQMFHVPNEGKRKPQYRAKMAKMGLVSGVSDYVIHKPSGGYPGLYLEVKTKTGTPSENQLTFMREVRLNGYMGIFGYGYEECHYICKEWIDGNARRIAWMQECDKKRERNAGWKARTNDATTEQAMRG